MMQSKLYQWMQHPEQLDSQSLAELRELLVQYPYFQTARLLYLKNLYLMDDPSFRDELAASVFYVPDLSVLFYYIEGERFSIRRHEKPADGRQPEASDRTLDLIDRFLSEMSGEQASELPELRPEIATDYTAILAREAEPQSPESDGQLSEEVYLTESLAKVYIRQKRYDKALEIIQRIYLTNPKKNAYFADQIRFLEKLIINAKTK